MRKALNLVSSIAFSFLFIACTETPSETEQTADLRTRYTFSQGKSIDFSVAGGTYQIVYDYSVPVDTMFGYSGAFLYGEDSLIYAQVRRTWGDFEEESNDIDPDYYHGEVTDLIMYNGSKSIVLTPPFFDPSFSAFCLNGNVLYYWGFDEEFKVSACRYDLKERKVKKVNLNFWAETDFFGFVDPPMILDNGTVVFERYEIDQWKFDLDLNIQKKPNQKPTYISPNS